MIDIREEQPADRAGIRRVVGAAFARTDEVDLVDRLRADGDAAISLVATDGGGVVGHAMFSRLSAPFRALALAPVSVVPGLQGTGIGSALIRAGLEMARTAGWQGVFVLGDPAFYRVFGFDAQAAAGFTCPYQGPYLMVHAPGGSLPAASGRIDYPAAFAALE